MPFSTDNLKCSQCDYLLRGLNESDCCPECGQPIHESAIHQRMSQEFGEKRLRFHINLWMVVSLIFAVWGLSQYLDSSPYIGEALIILLCSAVCAVLSCGIFVLCVRLYVIKQRMTREIAMGGAWCGVVWVWVFLLCVAG